MTTTSWAVDKLIQISLSNCKDIAYDGSDVWVLYGTDIKVINLWNSNTNHQGGLFSEYSPNIQPQDGTYDTVADIDVSSYGTSTKLVRGYNAVFCVSSGELLEISKTTHSVDYTHTLPGFTSSDVNAILFVNNKVWIVYRSGVRDYLITFDTTNDTWSSAVVIPGTQERDRSIGWSHHEYVYVCSFNDGLIHKYDSDDMSYQGDVYVNLRPTFIGGNDSQELLITSFNGLITRFNEDGDTLTHDHSTLGDNFCEGVVDDGTHLWSIAPGLVRTTKNTTPNVIKYQDDDTLNRHIGSFGGNDFNKMLLTPSFDYQFWDGSQFVTRTVSQYIVLMKDDSIFTFRVAPLQRNNYLKVRATGMIATGTGFYGDTR